METLPELQVLVDAAKRGDEEAWRRIYGLLYPRLLAYARWQIGDEHAADAVSETLVRAVSGIAKFSWRGAGFEAWMFKILRNVIVDTHRRNGRVRDLVKRSHPEPQEDDCADRLFANEEAARLRAAFQRLARADQEVLHLRVVEGLGSEEAAQVLGKRPGAVRMAQARALGRLRAILIETEAR